jgi:peptide/nickel transport system permease protein
MTRQGKSSSIRKNAAGRRGARPAPRASARAGSSTSTLCARPSVVTQFGIDLGILLGGAVVTETIFGLPGLGQLAILSVTQQDLPIITGVVILGAAFVVVANIVVDMLYPILDPRVRLR